ncbi:glycosyltransferase [bacterium]|nr:glycosyltransferase [bacterium]
MDLSIVVPTYRGAESLPELLDGLRSALPGVDYEVIVVNDASPDDTWAALTALAPTHPEMVAIDLLANRGQAIATLAGMAQARGSLVATMDDDLQQPPDQLPILIDALAANPRWDAAIGNWPRDHGLFRSFGSWVHAVVDRIAHGTPRSFRHTSLRAMRRPLVDALLSHETRTPVLGPLITQLSSETHNVDVAHHDRKYGSSTITLRESISRVTTNLIHGTTLPLKALSRIGLFAAFVALVVSIVFLIRWLLGVQTPPGWASSFLVTTFFGGTILFGIGLLGEYTSVVIKEVRRPPKWNIRERIGDDPPHSDA